MSGETRPDIIAIGASAGGVEAICNLIAKLPADLPAAVLVVLHRSPYQPSNFPAVISRHAQMLVRLAKEGSSVEHGVCLISPPERHLIVTPELRIHLLADGFYRSHNIDALFNSLARCAGPRTIGVVLSGLMKDGTLGLRSIKEAGGVALVQSPTEAVYPDMPESAILADGPIDLVGSVKMLAKEICRRVGAAEPAISSSV
jgi:two-component system, chemotaxis family, protein-glutamate methylesterase/glutaminase